MHAGLRQFQKHFAQALIAPDAKALGELAALANQPGFAVYRNTVMKACIDALQANYPAITRLVGEEWMRAAAAVFVRDHLPDDARMLYYGQGFAAFLATFEPAAELPYLTDVARLDRFWTEAHAAFDAPTLAADALASLAPEALAGVVLQPHASARWAWFADAPIYTIWHRNRQARDEERDIAWQGEGALLARPQAAVEWHPLSVGGCALLDACAEGKPLGMAAEAALAVQEDADLAQLLAQLLNAGAFSGMRRDSQP